VVEGEVPLVDPELSEDLSEEALSKLEPLQRGDFEEIFRAMDGLPVTVRLLDPRCTSSSPAPGS
jgi:phosphoenolpyruvate synthase/pyruvate phosphate dikinase